MALGTFIAGQYTITWNSLALGIMQGDQQSPVIEPVTKGAPIDNTDAYGRSTIDGIYQGGDYFSQYTAMEYKASTIAAMWPWGSFGVMGIVSRLWSDVAQALVFTAVAGTPAANSPATLTASKAIIAENFPIRLLFGPILRMIPIRQRLLWYSSGGNNVVFTQT